MASELFNPLFYLNKKLFLLIHSKRKKADLKAQMMVISDGKEFTLNSNADENRYKQSGVTLKESDQQAVGWAGFFTTQ